jgi:hypothetical protein
MAADVHRRIATKVPERATRSDVREMGRAVGAALLACAFVSGCGRAVTHAPGSAQNTPDAGGVDGPLLDALVLQPDAGTFVDGGGPTPAGLYNDVAVLGYQAVWIATYDGVIALGSSGWTTAISPAEGETFNGVWANAADDVWAVGYIPGPEALQGALQHWNGTTWTDESAMLTSAGSMYSVRGSAANDVWVVGSLLSNNAVAAVYHYDGSAWTQTYEGGPIQTAVSVWSAGPSDVWISGTGGVAHFDGTAWTPSNPPGADQTYSGHVWGTSSSDVWVAGGNASTGGASLFHWNGTAWSDAYDFPNNTGALGGWSASPSDAWAVGEVASPNPTEVQTGAAFHFDGATWASVPSGAVSEPLNAVGGNTPEDVWAVGNDVILRLE